MNRYTFVIKVHPGGISTLENLSTRERVRIADLGAVGPQVERWLASLPDSTSPDRHPGSEAGGQPPPAPPS
ncbi:MAG: hypothetical protein ACRDL3_03095 [Solirubrobacterales bacterium]